MVAVATSNFQRQQEAASRRPAVSSDPDDVDLSTLGSTRSTNDGLDALQAMLRGAGGPSMPGPNTLSDRLVGTESPNFANLPVTNQSMPPDGDIWSQLLGGAGLDSSHPLSQLLSGAAPANGQTLMMEPHRKTWLDRAFPLVHLVSMISLALIAVFILEPMTRNQAGGLRSFMDDWRGESGRVPWFDWGNLIGERSSGRSLGAKVVGTMTGAGLAGIVRRPLAQKLIAFTDYL